MRTRICFIIYFLYLFTTPTISQVSPLYNEWKQYLTRFNKVYANPLEELNRLKIWEKNWKDIVQHNLEYDLGLHSFKMGINQFTDLTHDEFKSIYLPNTVTVSANNNVSYSNLQTFQAPASLDWYKTGYVTPVKNQGSCGSCWAFSSIGSFESQFYKLNKTLFRFSEQQLVDCDTGNSNCGGGLMTKAFDYIRKSGGIQLETDYPYKSIKGACKFDIKKAVASCKNYKEVPNNEADLLNALVEVGPISVGFDASFFSFQSYSSGVYEEFRCSPKSLDHALLLVGYGSTSDGKKYWIAKNSWATSWGQNGFVWTARDKNNMCGIASMSSYPVLSSSLLGNGRTLQLALIIIIIFFTNLS